MPKQTLRKFTREFPSPEDVKRFREAMNAESDLVVAIVSAIEVEYLLEQLIILKFKRRDEEALELLTKENGALSSFFSKIGLAYALGILSADRMDHLNIVRRIRNAFAHSRKDISFSNELILDEMRALKLPQQRRSDLYRGINIAKQLVEAKLPQQPGLLGRAAYVILTQHLTKYLLSKQKKSYDARLGRIRSALKSRLGHDVDIASIKAALDKARKNQD